MADRVISFPQKELPKFTIKSNPIPCCEYEYAEDEEWSCEHCRIEGDDGFCTWAPEVWHPIEYEELNGHTPCWYWDERIQDARYFSPLKVTIFDTSDQKIGEISGWWLNPDMIIYDERNSFWAMDGVSDLLVCAHRLIIKQKYLFCRTGWLGEIPYITRLSLCDEHRSLEFEREILTSLLKGYGALIYSLGFTELDDDDFFEYQNDEWQSYWEEKLWKLGWLRDERLWYAFDHEQHLYVPDEILFGDEDTKY